MEIWKIITIVAVAAILSASVYAYYDYWSVSAAKEAVTYKQGNTTKVNVKTY